MQYNDEQRTALTKRALTTDDAETFGVLSIPDEWALPAGCPPWWTVENGYLPGLLFPRTSLNGDQSWQLRPDHPTTDIPKYVTIAGSPVTLNIMRHDSRNTVTLLVEGTVKALVAALYAPDTMNVISIDGCYNFTDDGVVSPDFRAVENTEVFVCLDADAATNLAVYTAGERIASAAWTYGCRSCRFVRIEGQAKDGLDDHLARYERDMRAARLAVLVNDARTRKGQSADKPASRKPDPQRDDNNDDATALRTYVVEHFVMARSDEGGVIGRRINGKRVAIPLTDVVRQSATEVYGPTGDVLTRRVVGDVEAYFSGLTDLPVVTMALRCHHRDDNTVLVDLGDDTGDVIHVTGDGWTITANDDDDLWYWRPPGMEALPRPETGGTLQQFRETFPVDDEQWAMILGWLIAGPFARFERPWLYFNGARGSGKTGTATQALIWDPVDYPLDMTDERSDPIATARKHFTPAYDNLSKVSSKQSDWLAALMTGITSERRTLYTDNDVTTVSLLRTGVFTGIDVTGIRPDLWERLINIPMRRHTERHRSKDNVRRDNRANGARYLGALLDAVSVAVRGLQAGIRHTGTYSRFEDYTAVLASYDAVHGTTLAETYAGVSERDREAEQRSDPTVMALLALVDTHDGDTGYLTAAVLHRELSDLTLTSHDPDVQGAYVPRSANGLSQFLNNNWAEPIDGVEFESKTVAGVKKKRLARVSMVSIKTATPSVLGKTPSSYEGVFPREPETTQTIDTIDTQAWRDVDPRVTYGHDDQEEETDDDELGICRKCGDICDYDESICDICDEEEGDE